MEIKKGKPQDLVNASNSEPQGGQRVLSRGHVASRPRSAAATVVEVQRGGGWRFGRSKRTEDCSSGQQVGDCHTVDCLCRQMEELLAVLHCLTEEVALAKFGVLRATSPSSKGTEGGPFWAWNTTEIPISPPPPWHTIDRPQSIRTSQVKSYSATAPAGHEGGT